MKVKTAVCSVEVPASLSHTGKDIKVGDTVQYTKIVYRNGEHHLLLPDGKEVPDIFFAGIKF